MQKKLIAKAIIDHGSRKVERWRRKNADVSGFPVGMWPGPSIGIIIKDLGVWEGRGKREAADALLMLVWFQVPLPVGAPGGIQREKELSVRSLAII